MTRPLDIPDFPASQLFLRRLAFHLVRDEARAEDLVQETWAAWVEHRPRGVAEPRAWLARVLRNRAFNWKRGEARRAEREALAGRPDPSEPETDGTLEAQAQLIAALRRLEEPFRSTLLQRYYHDLSPKEIAEREGAPLNTVKARLARGLEKLRAAMDRRYDGDRKAWCHWLGILGAPPVVLPAGPTGPAGPAVGAGGATLASSPAWTAVSPWLLIAGALMVIVTWIAKDARLRSTLVAGTNGEPMDTSVPVEVEPSRRDTARAPEAPKRGEARAPVPAPARPKRFVPPRDAAPIAPGPEPPDSAARPFEYLQYRGSPTHDTSLALIGTENAIHRPRVAWTLPTLSGQPTLSGRDLYSGGSSLHRVDPATGRILDSLEDGRLHVSGPRGGGSDLGKGLRRHGLAPDAAVVGAPIIDGHQVIARFVADGSVSAFDRRLQTEKWRWEPLRPASSFLPGCFVGTRFVLAQREDVIVLDARNGTVEWSQRLPGEIDMVPASDGRRVFVATTDGEIFALNLLSGEREWSVQPSARNEAGSAVIDGEKVIFDGWESKPASRKFQYADGLELSSASDPLAKFGLSSSWAWMVLSENADALEEIAGELKSDEFELAAPPALFGSSICFAMNVGGSNGTTLFHLSDGTGPSWRYHEPGERIFDLVHTGYRIFLVTYRGLVCIEDDPEEGPLPEGFTLIDADLPR